MFWLLRATSFKLSMTFTVGQQVLLATQYLSIEINAFDNNTLKLTQAFLPPGFLQCT